MRLPEIIGVSGTNGSGKDTLAALRAEKENAMHASLSDILREHLRAEGIPCERKNMADLSRRWREEYLDNGILVAKTIESYLAQRALMGYDGLSVVSLRHPDEAHRIKDFGGMVLWVDADPRVRYDRIQTGRRNREDDNKTFEEFLTEEERELRATTTVGSGVVNLGAVEPLADDHITNNFASETEYIAYLMERFEIG